MGHPAESDVRTATADELDRVRRALAKAFQDDPVFGWLMPDDASRAARLRRFFGRELHHVLQGAG